MINFMYRVIRPQGTLPKHLFELIGSADGYNAMMRGGIMGWLQLSLERFCCKEKVSDVTEYTIEGMK